MLQAMTFGLISDNGRERERHDTLAEGLRRLMRFLVMLLGAGIMVLGFAIAPLPGPFGLPIAVVGMMLILRNSIWAKRKFIKLQHARPNWVYPIRRLMRREPEVAPVMWQQTLRTERLLLNRDARFLARTRRRVVRWKRRRRAERTRS
ncbi:hypothetical protein [Caulobacter sp. 17J65-9]|uniref:hypothetical protein n=1 Tax=Caulobacter sp. 17J65-9 TaxID=2709382 RepID=UPI001F08F458|nr:hypothetical protein [Caulobacter sp. 17J65-9]